MSGIKGKSGGHNRLSDRDRAINGDKHKANYKGVRNPPSVLSGVISHEEIGKLGDAGRKMFDMLFPILDKTHIISQTDSIAFYLLCDSFDAFEKAKKTATRTAIFETGEIRNGIPVVIKRSELLKDMNDARRQLISQLKDFGLDPDARSKIIAQASGEEEDGVDTL